MGYKNVAKLGAPYLEAETWAYKAKQDTVVRAVFSATSAIGDKMQDLINLVTLICAALASMGVGVYAAYALIRAGFALMHWHARQNAPARLEATTRPAPVS